jgi:hypothetical protein
MLALASGPADAAPNIAGTSFDTCGKWIDKLRDFGKFKIRNYNDYIPLNFQAPTPYDVPRVRIEFGDGSGTGVDGLCAAGTSCFRMQFYFTDEMGVWWEVSASGAPVMLPGGGLVPFTEEAFGSYNQKGKNVKMSLDPAPGDEGLRRMLSNTGQLALFGERNLIVAIGGPLVVDPDGPIPCQIDPSGTLGRCTPVPTLRKTRIKARLKGNGSLKFKIKSKLRYDIDTDVVDDVFDAGGRMNFKGKGNDCPLPAPPPS